MRQETDADGCRHGYPVNHSCQSVLALDNLAKQQVDLLMSPSHNDACPQLCQSGLQYVIQEHRAQLKRMFPSPQMDGETPEKPNQCDV